MKYSKDGYKRNSKDKNNPYNIIPSGNITMEGVDFPVFGMDNLGYNQIMMPGANYTFPGNSVFEIPLLQIGGNPFQPAKRQGVRNNPDGSESTHLMRTETIDGINWVSFPTLFQNEDGTWLDLSQEENWKIPMMEARKRGEVVHFGQDKEAALRFGEGSWKMQNGGDWKEKAVRFFSPKTADKIKDAENKFEGYSNPNVNRILNTFLGNDANYELQNVDIYNRDADIVNTNTGKVDKTLTNFAKRNIGNAKALNKIYEDYNLDEASSWTDYVDPFFSWNPFDKEASENRETLYDVASDIYKTYPNEVNRHWVNFRDKQLGHLEDNWVEGRDNVVNAVDDAWINTRDAVVDFFTWKYGGSLPKIQKGNGEGWVDKKYKIGNYHQIRNQDIEDILIGIPGAKDAWMDMSLEERNNLLNTINHTDYDLKQILADIPVGEDGKKDFGFWDAVDIAKNIETSHLKPLRKALDMNKREFNTAVKDSVVNFIQNENPKMDPNVIASDADFYQGLSIPIIPFIDYQKGGEKLPRLKVINYPYGYRNMPPGHIEAALIDEHGNYLEDYNGMIPYINRWETSGNKPVRYKGKNKDVRTSIINLSESELNQFLKAAQTFTPGESTNIPFTDLSIPTAFGGNKGDYDFVNSNCADGVCLALGMDASDYTRLGITDPKLVMDAIVKRDDVIKNTGNAVGFWEGVDRVTGFSDGVSETWEDIEDTASDVWEGTKDLASDTWDWLTDWQYGGSLPKAQNGISGYNPYALQDQVAVQDNTYYHIPPPIIPTSTTSSSGATISQGAPEPSWYEKLFNVIANPVEAFGRSVHNQDWWTGNLGQGLPISPQHSIDNNPMSGLNMMNMVANPFKWVEDIGDAVEEGDYTDAAIQAGLILVPGGKLAKNSKVVKNIQKNIKPKTVYNVTPTNTNVSSVADDAYSIGNKNKKTQKVLDENIWTTQNPIETTKYAMGDHSANSIRKGLLTGEPMTLTEYKIRFPWLTGNVGTNKTIRDLKKSQGASLNLNEYLIPKKRNMLNRFLYPKVKTTDLQPVPTHLLDDNLFNAGSYPLTFNSANYFSKPYKYVSDQVKGATGVLDMPFEFSKYTTYNPNLGYNVIQTNKPASYFDQTIQDWINKQGYYKKGGSLPKAQDGQEQLSQQEILDYHKFVAEQEGLSLEEVQDSSKYNIINPESKFYVSPENRAPGDDDVWNLYKNIGWNIASVFPDMFGEDEKVDLDKLASDKNKLDYIDKWKENQNIQGETNSGEVLNPVQGNVYSTSERDFIINDLKSPGYRKRLTRELALDNNIDESEVTDEMLDEVIDGRMNNILSVQEFSGYPGEYTDVNMNTLDYSGGRYTNDQFDYGIGGVKTQGDNLLYSRIYYGGDYGDDATTDLYGGTPFHELTHATATGHWYQNEDGEWERTPGGLTAYASNLLSQSKIPHKLKDQIPEDAYSYESDDDEVYTRYKKAQRLLKDLGIYDYTTGEKMTDEEYAKIKEYMNSSEFKNRDDWDDLKEFFGTDTFFKYGEGWNEKLEEEEIRNIFDNVADANTGMLQGMAKYGGSLPKAEDGGGIDYNSLQKGIKWVESLNGELMKNPHSSASGYYGQLFDEIEYDGTRDEFIADTDYQDELFRKRAHGEIKDVPGLIDNGIQLSETYKNVDHGYTPLEIAALSNFLGRQGTREYLGYVLRDGDSLAEVFPHLYGADVKQANKTPDEYIEKFREGLSKKSKGGEFLNKIKRLNQQLKIFNSGGRISPLAKQELIKLEMIKPEMQQGGAVQQNSYVTKRGDNLSRIARNNNMTLAELLRLNPRFASNPSAIGIGDVIQLSDAPVQNNSTPNMIYKIEKGDSLSKIASRYGVRYQDIAALNNISDPSKIMPGQQIRLPDNAVASGPNVVAQQQRANSVYIPSQANVHVNSNTNVNEVWNKREKVNGAWTNNGRRALINEINKDTQANRIVRGMNDNAESQTINYTIQSGDMLGKIAQKNGVSVKKLMEDNNITDPTKIQPGQNLTINKSSGKPYLVVDEKAGRMHMYYPGSDQPFKSYPIVSGLIAGDQQTKTVISFYKDGEKLDQTTINKLMEENDFDEVGQIASLPGYSSKTDWSLGNKSTGAGVYTIGQVNEDSGFYDETGEGRNAPSFVLKNQAGNEPGTVIHATPHAGMRGRLNALKYGTSGDDQRDMNVGTNGCINGTCSAMIELFENPDIGEGTQVFVLPEDYGNNFVYENGKVNFYTKGVNDEAAETYMAVGPDGKPGTADDIEMENKIGLNETPFDQQGNYKPINITFDKEYYQTNSPRYDGLAEGEEAEFNEATKPFLNSLVDNKKYLMETLGMDGDTYNDLSMIAFGIYGYESGMGDTNSMAENILKGGTKLLGMQQTNPDVQTKQGFQNIKNMLTGDDGDWDSVGYTQAKWGWISQDENAMKIMDKLGIDESNYEEWMMDPEKNAQFTIARLYDFHQKEQASISLKNQKIREENEAVGRATDPEELIQYDPYTALPNRWSPTSPGYVDKVNSYTDYITLTETDIDDVDNNLIIKGEFSDDNEASRQRQREKDWDEKILNPGETLEFLRLDARDAIDDVTGGAASYIGEVYDDTLEAVDDAWVEGRDAVVNTVSDAADSVSEWWDEVDLNPFWKLGGEFGVRNQVQFYNDYISGVYKGTRQENSANKLYDKLNRMYYNDSKKSGKSQIDVMRSILHNNR